MCKYSLRNTTIEALSRSPTFPLGFKVRERRSPQYTPDLKDLDQLIRGLEQTTVEQNIIVDLQEEQIRKVKLEKEQFKQQTPIPYPYLISTHFEELQHQIEMFGTVKDVATIYKAKLYLKRSIGKKGKGKVEFNIPFGVELDCRGKLFIIDMNNNRIQVISVDGQFIGEIGKGEVTYLGLTTYLYTKNGCL